MEMPEAEAYEATLKYMPYKDSLSRVLGLVVRDAPRNGRVLDMMCGPGYLLGEIDVRGHDLTLVGVDNNPRYIEYARWKHPSIRFELGDVCDWPVSEPFDYVLCTGALHHVEYARQDEAMANLAALAKPGGTVIISDCYIDDYADEMERKLAAATLGHHYLVDTIKNGAPPDVVEELINILRNDVMGTEFKTSLMRRAPQFRRNFKSVDTFKSWPDTSCRYGDYIHVCRTFDSPP